MSRKKSLMPRTRGDGPPPPPTRLEKLFPTDRTHPNFAPSNYLMLAAGEEWQQMAIILYEGGSPASPNLILINSSPQKDGAMAHRLDQRGDASYWRDRMGENATRVLDRVIYHGDSMKKAAEIILGRDNPKAESEMRGRFRQALEIFASIRKIPGT